MSTTVIAIDCSNREWKSHLKQTLQEGHEVDVMPFDYTADGEFCEMLALGHK